MNYICLIVVHTNEFLLSWYNFVDAKIREIFYEAEFQKEANSSWT